MKPIIGITSGCDYGHIASEWPIIYSNQQLVERIIAAHAIPIILPFTQDEATIENYTRMVDGMIVSGEALNLYNLKEVNGGSETLKHINPKRYDYEYKLISLVLAANLPTLAICRGYQVLNDVMGGKLKQQEVLTHRGYHNIHIDKGTKLFSMIAEESISVNSLHRQVIDQVGEGLIVSATSVDGFVEAIESIDHDFVIGTQFHPESLEDHKWETLFVSLVQKAGSRKLNKEVG